MWVVDYIIDHEKWFYCHRLKFEESMCKKCRETIIEYGLNWDVKNPYQFLQDIITWLHKNKLYIALMDVRWGFFVIRRMDKGINFEFIANSGPNTEENWDEADPVKDILDMKEKLGIPSWL